MGQLWCRWGYISTEDDRLQLSGKDDLSELSQVRLLSAGRLLSVALSNFKIVRAASWVEALRAELRPRDLPWSAYIIKSSFSGSHFF